MANQDSAANQDLKPNKPLGVQLGVYRVRHWFLATWISLFLDILAILAGFVLLGWSGYTAYETYYYHGLAAAERDGLIPILLGCFLLAIGLIGVGSTIPRFRQRVNLFENGLEVKKNGVVKTIYWDEFSSIRSQYRHNLLSTERNLILSRQDGERIILDGSIGKVDQLNQIIREKTLTGLYQRYSPAFAENLPLAFGPIRVSRESGLQIKRKTIPWQEVHVARVEKGHLILDALSDGKKPKRLEIPASEIPNLEVLLAFINDCSGRNYSK